MPFLTHDPFPQCLQQSPLTPLLLPPGTQRGSRRYLSNVKCLRDRDRAREVHVVGVVAVVDRRHGGQDVGRAPRRLLADADCDPVVDIDRQVRPVLLDGAQGQQDHPTLANRLVDLGPGHLGEQVLACHPYSLTAPMVRPRTSQRCITRANAITGSTISVPMADIGPQSVPLSVTKAEIRTGRGVAGLGAAVEASRNSFQLRMAVSTAAVATRGAASGSTTWRKRCHTLAPSMMALSSSSFGSSSRKPSSSQTTNGRPSEACARISAVRVSRSPAWRARMK